MAGSTAEQPVRAGQGVTSDVERLPNVAVIAVHGVADQQPFESARQIADLLLRQRREDETAGYTSFREFPLRIPIDRPVAAGTVSAAHAADLRFTHQVISEYQTERSVYETIRLEGNRLGAAFGKGLDAEARDQANVHVYEMYWADLSRLGTGVIGVAGAAFQLISSLASLGVRTLKQSEYNTRRERARGVAVQAHAFAVWSLTVAIPFLNLALLVVALSVPVAAAPAWLQATGVGLLLAVVTIGGSSWAWLRWGRGSAVPIGGLVTAILVSGLLSVAVGMVLARAGGAAAIGASVAVAGLVGATAVIVLAEVYKRRQQRPWLVRSVGALLGVVVAVGLVRAAWRAGDAVDAADGIIHLFELMFWGMGAMWLLMLLAGLVGGGAAAWVSRDHATFRRSAWTAATTMALSMSTVAVAAIVLWSAIQVVVGRTLPGGTAREAGDSVFVSATGRRYARTPDGSFGYKASPRQIVFASDAVPARDSTAPAQMCFSTQPVGPDVTAYYWCSQFSQKSMPRYLVSVSAASGLLVALFCLLLLVVVGGFLVAPSVLREIRPKNQGKRAQDASPQLGKWVTSGFVFFRRASILGYALLLAGTLAVSALGLWLWLVPGHASWAGAVFWHVRSWSDKVALGIGSLVAASTVGALVLLSRFETIARVVRPALDVMLDVDNYLRELPRSKLPRAGMLERLVSLLCYIARWQRSGRGYDAVVFVAHSQGTVLVADALRFHHAVGFAGLTSARPGDTPSPGVLPPVYLMTMGSPLRQLYERAFPHHFAWAGTSEKPTTGPDCDSLGVREWTNVFRSGDYVGRALWHSPDDEATYAVLDHPEPDADQCRERCLGEGAHTHYWDGTAPDVGKDLDAIVGKALQV